MKMSLNNFLAETDIYSIVAMPLGKVAGFYLDVVFSGQSAAVRFTGGAADMADGTEAFFVTVEEFDPAQKWTGPDGQPGWLPVDLTTNWSGSPLESLFHGPRVVRYYRDLEDGRRGLVGCAVLGAAAAVEISSATRQERVVLYATTEYPCALELATDTNRCHEILGRLDEFHPETVDAVLITSPCP